jgi:hypothetical protein
MRTCSRRLPRTFGNQCGFGVCPITSFSGADSDFPLAWLRARAASERPWCVPCSLHALPTSGVGGVSWEYHALTFVSLVLCTVLRCAAHEIFDLDLVANPLRLFANLFPGTLSCQGLLYSELFAGLQIEGVTLHFLYDVFSYNFSLETT